MYTFATRICKWMQCAIQRLSKYWLLQIVLNIGPRPVPGLHWHVATSSNAVCLHQNLCTTFRKRSVGNDPDSGPRRFITINTEAQHCIITWASPHAMTFPPNPHVSIILPSAMKWVRFPAGTNISLFTTTSRPDMEPTQPMATGCCVSDGEVKSVETWG